jgi:pSer/pThr/pTyr-binding forkhead associated (FHA) protein
MSDDGQGLGPGAVEPEDFQTQRPPAPRASGPDTTMTFGQVEPVEIESGAPVGLTADEVAAVHALPPTSALLVMQRGPSAGARFLLDAERTTAGRSTRSDIFLDDVTVSRTHAVLLRSNGSFVIEDQGSLNGTFVNRRRIDSSPLADGDEVQIGKYRLTFLEK